MKSVRLRSLSGHLFDSPIAINETDIWRRRAAGRPAGPLRPRLIDLFAGAGGMSLGFTSFGHRFVPVWANDSNEDAAATYRVNFKRFGAHCSTDDIVNLLKDKNFHVPKADVVIGGPPCQGFSLLNKDRDTDPRKQLWRPFMEVVEMSGADAFVIENVPQI